MEPDKLIERYGKSKRGNFFIADTIGVPHPYCITPRHVEEASDYWCGRLGTEAIKAAESKGARCGMSGCRLTIEEHEQALLVSCKRELKNNDKVNPELENYLLACKEKAVEDKFAGFAFVKV